MGDTDDTESMLVDTKSKITFFFLLNLKILGFDFFFFFFGFYQYKLEELGGILSVKGC